MIFPIANICKWFAGKRHDGKTRNKKQDGVTLPGLDRNGGFEKVTNWTGIRGVHRQQTWLHLD